MMAIDTENLEAIFENASILLHGTTFAIALKRDERRPRKKGGRAG